MLLRAKLQHNWTNMRWFYYVFPLIKAEIKTEIETKYMLECIIEYISLIKGGGVYSNIIQNKPLPKFERRSKRTTQNERQPKPVHKYQTSE